MLLLELLCRSFFQEPHGQPPILGISKAHTHLTLGAMVGLSSKWEVHIKLSQTVLAASWGEARPWATPPISPDGSCLILWLHCAMCHLVPVPVPFSWACVPEQTMARTIAPPAPSTTLP